MARRKYTDRDKAIVYAELMVNEGNIKRTARNTGIDVSAVRRWKAEWEANGVPPEITKEVEHVASDFVSDAVRIRGKLLQRLEAVLDAGDRATIPQLVTGIGVLSDKIRAYEAITETKKVEHTFTLPPVDELRELFSGLVGGMLNAARERAAEIEAFEEPISTTYRELPKAEED
jgi:transposase-like protein